MIAIQLHTEHTPHQYLPLHNPVVFHLRTQTNYLLTCLYPQAHQETVGTYDCHTAESSSNTSQKEPQKANTTDLDLYTYPEADIVRGDILYIYELDEYDKIPLTKHNAFLVTIFEVLCFSAYSELIRWQKSPMLQKAYPVKSTSYL